MDISLEESYGGRPVLRLKTDKGSRYIDAESVFVRATDGKVFIAGNVAGGQMRGDLTDEEQAMVALLPRVGGADEAKPAKKPQAKKAAAKKPQAKKAAAKK